MEKYERVEMDVIAFSNEEIILTSSGDDLQPGDTPIG